MATGRDRVTESGAACGERPGVCVQWRGCRPFRKKCEKRSVVTDLRLSSDDLTMVTYLGRAGFSVRPPIAR